MPNGRRRARQREERPTEDGKPDEGWDARRNNERSTEDVYIDTGLNAQRDMERSCTFFVDLLSLSKKRTGALQIPLSVES